MFRLDSRLGWSDIDMRMENVGDRASTTLEKFINAMNNRCARGREKFSMVSWREKSKHNKPNKIRDKVLARLSQEQKDANGGLGSTRGSTPGSLDSLGNLIPVPTTKKARKGQQNTPQTNSPSISDASPSNRKRNAASISRDTEDGESRDYHFAQRNESDLAPRKKRTKRALAGEDHGQNQELGAAPRLAPEWTKRTNSGSDYEDYLGTFPSPEPDWVLRPDFDLGRYHDEILKSSYEGKIKGRTSNQPLSRYQPRQSSKRKRNVEEYQIEQSQKRKRNGKKAREETLLVNEPYGLPPAKVTRKAHGPSVVHGFGAVHRLHADPSRRPAPKSTSWQSGAPTLTNSYLEHGIGYGLDALERSPSSYASLSSEIYENLPEFASSSNSFYLQNNESEYLASRHTHQPPKGPVAYQNPTIMVPNLPQTPMPPPPTPLPGTNRNNRDANPLSENITLPVPQNNTNTNTSLPEVNLEWIQQWTGPQEEQDDATAHSTLLSPLSPTTTHSFNTLPPIAENDDVPEQQAATNQPDYVENNPMTWGPEWVAFVQDHDASALLRAQFPDDYP